jgi:hypothetical protein
MKLGGVLIGRKLPIVALAATIFIVPKTPIWRCSPGGPGAAGDFFWGDTLKLLRVFAISDISGKQTMQDYLRIKGFPMQYV